MKVISISTDRKILDKNSTVSRRMAEYRKLFDQLDTVVLNGKVSGIFSAYRTAKNLIKNSKLKIENCVVSTQDPFETGVIGVLLKLFYGTPLQIQLHTDFNNKYFLLSTPLNFIRFFIAHLTLPFADEVRVVSERSKKGVEALAKNITVLPISQRETLKIPVPKVSPWESKEEITILTVARLEKEKDIETAIKAFTRVSNKNTEFIIVGDGSERARLQKTVNRLQLGNRVKFVGWQNDLKGFYEKADIYISTSLFEGYGMSLVEAASYGLPLVLSDAGITGQVFKNGESALVCSVKDVNCFVRALNKLLQDQDLRHKIGESAKIAVAEHLKSWGDYLSAYKKSTENALVNYKPMNFFGRAIEFIRSIFRGNKVLRFIFAGGTAGVTQIVILYICTDLFGFWYLFSSVIAFVFALAVSFTLQKVWAFRDKERKGTHVKFFKYMIIALLGVALNTVLMYFFVDILHIWYILSQIIAGFTIAVLNFFAYRKFIFT